jgi:hypothetical protein
MLKKLINKIKTMCGCANCNGITLFSGTDGVGIQSITDNNNGTFTILLTNGTTWTSEDLTGPQGATGSTGAAGTNGTNGTNAFKFVKEFETNNDDATITISQEELTTCANVPNGCLFESIEPGFTNIQVQVWLRNNDPSPSGPWYLGDSSNSSFEIDASTGTISCTLTGGGNDVLARIVVIA